MTMNIHDILKKLPHRYPMLMVDRVLELEHGKRIKAVKNVSAIHLARKGSPGSSTAAA